MLSVSGTQDMLILSKACVPLVQMRPTWTLWGRRWRDRRREPRDAWRTTTSQTRSWETTCCRSNSFWLSPAQTRPQDQSILYSVKWILLDKDVTLLFHFWVKTWDVFTSFRSLISALNLLDKHPFLTSIFIHIHLAEEGLCIWNEWKGIWQSGNILTFCFGSVTEWTWNVRNNPNALKVLNFSLTVFTLGSDEVFGNDTPFGHAVLPGVNKVFILSLHFNLNVTFFYFEPSVWAQSQNKE